MSRKSAVYGLRGRVDLSHSHISLSLARRPSGPPRRPPRRTPMSESKKMSRSCKRVRGLVNILSDIGIPYLSTETKAYLGREWVDELKNGDNRRCVDVEAEVNEIAMYVALALGDDPRSGVLVSRAFRDERPRARMSESSEGQETSHKGGKKECGAETHCSRWRRGKRKPESASIRDEVYIPPASSEFRFTRASSRVFPALQHFPKTETQLPKATLCRLAMSPFC
ncbi:hypothetical protein E4T56_gene727 [Termitomyces sp. T112]|nr:hypothetical protein E4T56_gene727 [Termitomyces sp. T112]